MAAICTSTTSIKNALCPQEHSRLSPLGRAIKNEKYKKALALIKDAAAVQIVESNGTNNLRQAISKRPNIALIKTLLSHADIKTINYVEELYGSPLSQASFLGNVEIVHLLVAKGAGVNNTTRKQQTPLMYAMYGNMFRGSEKSKRIVQAFKRQLDTARALVIYGAQVNAMNEEGLTALEIYVEEQIGRPHGLINPHLISLLIEYGANPSKILIKPSRRIEPPQEITAKIEKAVQEGLVLKSIRTNRLSSPLSKYK